ncbi:MAG: trypsin-like serine protease [Terrimicrobiaceae bacterium]|nr:trypsin-like serine protease [Terrimicrobiaceae bacterium]
MNIRRIPPLLLLAASFHASALSAFAVVRRDDRPDSAYRKLGNRAAFNPVGRVEIDYGNGFEAIGTATLYGRDRLVSAAHVFDSEALAGAQSVRINFGRGRIQTIDFGTSGVVNIHPGYNPSTLRNDVSVVFLSQPFTLAPARLYTGKRIRLGAAITFVGYGDTGTGLTGSSQFSIIKRGGQNALGRYVAGGADFEVDFDRPGTVAYNSLGSSNALRLEGLLGPGDSGGSVWVRRNGRWRVVGINDYGLDWFPNGRGNGVNDDYGDRSGFVYLPRYAKWMSSLPQPNFNASRGLPSAALAAVPEPAPILLLGLAGATLLIFRRRAGALNCPTC